MMDNSEHETAMLDMVKDHCDVRQIQDKIQIIDALRSAISDVFTASAVCIGSVGGTTDVITSTHFNKSS